MDSCDGNGRSRRDGQNQTMNSTMRTRLLVCLGSFELNRASGSTFPPALTGW